MIARCAGTWASAVDKFHEVGGRAAEVAQAALSARSDDLVPRDLLVRQFPQRADVVEGNELVRLDFPDAERILLLLDLRLRR